MRIAIAFSVVLLFSTNALSQYPPCKKGNSDLYLLAAGETVESVEPGCDPAVPVYATSFLPAEGQAPPEEDMDAYQSWTCMYSPGKVSDGSEEPTWVEGAAGHGYGETLLVGKLDLGQSVEIWAGYGKSEELHKVNGRPKLVRVLVVGFARWELVGDFCTETYYDLTVLAENVVTLEDLNGFQPLAIPSYTLAKNPTMVRFSKTWEGTSKDVFLGLQILDVYAGSKYSDTCISEIRNKL